VIRYLFAALAGFMAGALWLLAMGVPFILPSWLDLRARVEVREAAAQGQAEAFDASEAIRKDEGVAAIIGVDDERQSCAAEIASLSAMYERALEQALGDQNHENANVDPIGGRNIRPPGGRVPDDTAMGED